MNSISEHTINNYRRIEAICIQNHDVWANVPEFRGAFSRFALKVAQLDLIAHNDNALTHFLSNPLHSLEKLLRDIEQILLLSFDRYFDYLRKRNQQFYNMYSSVRIIAD
jgi:hypothetical protein